jgi:Protein of unknown function (DUF2568)
MPGGLYGGVVASGRTGLGSVASGTVLTIRFLTELAMLAALAGAGAAADTGVAWRIVLAILGPVLAAVIWGVAIGPRARRRLADPLRLVVEFALFLAASAGLALDGFVLAAVIFAILAIGTAVLVRVVTPGS